MKRTNKQLHRLIGMYIKKWKSNLFLGMWTIEFYLRDYIVPEKVAGDVESDWRYFNAVINFSYVQLCDMEDKEIEKIVIHELLHIVVNEMREDGIDHEERVVSHLEMIFGYKL